MLIVLSFIGLQYGWKSLLERVLLTIQVRVFVCSRDTPKTMTYYVVVCVVGVVIVLVVVMWISDEVRGMSFVNVVV